MGKEFPGYPELAPISEAAWIAAMTLASMEFKGTTLATLTDMFIRESLAPLMIAEGEKTFRFIRQIALSVKAYGQKALLVSHWPLIECALAFATNDWPPKISLRQGEILAFQFNREGRFIGWRQPHQLFT